MNEPTKLTSRQREILLDLAPSPERIVFLVCQYGDAVRSSDTCTARRIEARLGKPFASLARNHATRAGQMSKGRGHACDWGASLIRWSFSAPMKTVFLSSTGTDLSSFRKAAHEAIRGLDGYSCVWMEDFGARAWDADNYCRNKVAECDIFVGILGHFHGSCPPGKKRSYTEREYESALRANKPCLIFVATDDFPLRPSEIESDDKRRRQQAFRKRVSKELIRGSFQSPEELARKVQAALHNLAQEQRVIAPVAPPALSTPTSPQISPATKKTSKRASAGRPPCPYRGLSAFQERDAPLFFGREAFNKELLKAVRKRPFVAVIGASGSGKSSVVFAGLLPRLRQEGPWQIAVLRPGPSPGQQLAAALVALLQPDMTEIDRLVETKKLAEKLRSGDLTLPDVISRILGRQSDPTTRVLLVVDQFEELYTLCRVEEDRRRFLDNLLDAIAVERSQATPRFTVVLTLRADFTGHAISYRPLADVLQHADVKLGPMNREEMKEAIEKPAHQQGVRLEDELTDRMLDALHREPGNLPLVEFALTLLWDHQVDGELTHKAYDAIGGVGRALATYAEQVFTQLGDAEREQTERVFVQLVVPGEGTEDARRQATRNELGDPNWDLIGRLATARLVVTGQNAVTGEDTVEIVHEALIREWERFRQWLDKAREFRLWQERLRASLRQWQLIGENEGALLRGALLNEAESWLTRTNQGISAGERRFIRESREHVSREEQQRRRAEQVAFKLAALVEASADAIIGVTLAGSIESWNPGAEHILGYAAAEVIDQPVRVLLPSDNAPMLARLKDVGELGRVSSLDVSLKRKDGSLLDMSITVSPIKNAQGQVVGLSLIGRDVSLTKQLQQQLRDRVEQLAAGARRRDEFLAMLAHELRNPLAPIRNALHIMKMPGAIEDQRRSAWEMADRQLAHLVRLIDDLLDVARFTLGKIHLRQEPVELNDLVTQAVEATRQGMVAAGHQLQISLPAESIQLTGDRIRLVQLLSNLLQNAIRFSEPSGQIALVGNREGTEVVIRVRDNGIGIAPEFVPHLFEMFSQAERSPARTQGGLGVGLALARKIVELHGGAIEAHSAGPGKGSEFIVRLPAIALAGASMNPGVSPSIGRSSARSRKILIVEDNADAAESLAMLLQLKGHEAHIALDGLSALKMIQSFVPEIVFLDIGLPHMDGYEVAKRLRQQPALQQTMLVALTGYGQEEDRRRSQEVGFNQHCVKPIDPIALDRLLGTEEL